MLFLPSEQAQWHESHPHESGWYLKGRYAVSREEVQTENFDAYNINKVMIQTQEHLFHKQVVLRAKKGPPNTVWSLKIRRGSPNVNKVKPYETVLSFEVIVGVIWCRVVWGTDDHQLYACVVMQHVLLAGSRALYCCKLDQPQDVF